jgi:hypothetical protein
VSFVATASESINVTAPDTARRPGLNVAKPSGDHTSLGSFFIPRGKNEVALSSNNPEGENAKGHS